MDSVAIRFGGSAKARGGTAMIPTNNFAEATIHISVTTKNSRDIEIYKLKEQLEIALNIGCSYLETEGYNITYQIRSLR